MPARPKHLEASGRRRNHYGRYRSTSASRERESLPVISHLQPHGSSCIDQISNKKSVLCRTGQSKAEASDTLATCLGRHWLFWRSSGNLIGRNNNTGDTRAPVSLTFCDDIRWPFGYFLPFRGGSAWPLARPDDTLNSHRPHTGRINCGAAIVSRLV